MKLKSIAGICALLACTGAAQATEVAGHLLVSAGWLHFMPRDKSGFLTVEGQPQPNTGASVKRADSLGFSATYFIDNNFAGELVLGTPPKFDLKGKGALSQLGQLGSVRQWSPTVLLKYYLFDSSAKLRPYVGIGGTRVWFKNARITSPALENQLGGPTTVSAKNAWSPVFNAGLSYQFQERLFGGVSVSYVPLRTTANLTTHTEAGKVVSSYANIKINPIVTYLNVGYMF